MMKKVLICFIALLLVMQFAGCQKKESSENTSSSQTTAGDTTNNNATSKQTGYQFDGKVKIENGASTLELELPVAVEEMTTYGEIDKESLEYELEPNVGMSGIMLEWNKTEIGLSCKSDTAAKLSESTVVGIDLSKEDKNVTQLTINGFSFDMSPEDIIEICGQPTEKEEEGEGVCYRYSDKAGGFLFAFENGQMSQMSFGIS